MFFRCGMRMSFKQVINPHMKKSVESSAMARASVRVGDCAMFNWSGLAMVVIATPHA